MKSLPDFKRGDSFAATCLYKVDGIAAPITGFVIESQIRTGAGDLVETLQVVSGAAVGAFTLQSNGPTDAWPVAGLRCDIQITDGTTVISSDTFLIPVVQDITQ